MIGDQWCLVSRKEFAIVWRGTCACLQVGNSRPGSYSVVLALLSIRRVRKPANLATYENIRRLCNPEARANPYLPEGCSRKNNKNWQGRLSIS